MVQTSLPDEKESALSCRHRFHGDDRALYRADVPSTTDGVLPRKRYTERRIVANATQKRTVFSTLGRIWRNRELPRHAVPFQDPEHLPQRHNGDDGHNDIPDGRGKEEQQRHDPGRACQKR